jgi:hypothetical protein
VVGEGIETTWAFAQELGRPCRAVAALSLENLQGHPVKLRDGALPLWALGPTSSGRRSCSRRRARSSCLVDADMKPLRGIRVQLTEGEKPLERTIGGSRSGKMCAQLATQFWRRAGATRGGVRAAAAWASISTMPRGPRHDPETH